MWGQYKDWGNNLWSVLSLARFAVCKSDFKKCKEVTMEWRQFRFIKVDFMVQKSRHPVSLTGTYITIWPLAFSWYRFRGTCSQPPPLNMSTTGYYTHFVITPTTNRNIYVTKYNGNYNNKSLFVFLFLFKRIHLHHTSTDHEIINPFKMLQKRITGGRHATSTLFISSRIAQTPCYLIFCLATTSWNIC